MASTREKASAAIAGSAAALALVAVHSASEATCQSQRPEGGIASTFESSSCVVDTVGDLVGNVAVWTVDVVAMPVGMAQEFGDYVGTELDGAELAERTSDGAVNPSS